jgi:endonuclease/exonuclease/phosphatase family metal-dependent hydrolase
MTRAAAAAALLVLAGCASAANYDSPLGPRFAGTMPAPATTASADTIHVVAFNFAFARQTARAIELLRSRPGLAGADLVLLQEMDAPSTEAVAESLGFSWVYYPASLHPTSRRDFGNAVLSRWPIVADRKIILPHRARVRGSQRVAVAVTVQTPRGPLRVYSVHLATMIGNGPGARRDQLRAVLADADSFPTVLIGGDYNSETVPEIALDRGYAWPTRGLPHTNGVWTFDHFLVRGLALARDSAIGVVHNEGTSDHNPVWAVLVRSEGR